MPDKLWTWERFFWGTRTGVSSFGGGDDDEGLALCDDPMADFVQVVTVGK